MRRLRTFAALCLLIGLLLAGLPARAYAQDDPTQLSPDGERAALLINQLRANAGLPPLRVHPLLTLAANRHIQNMTSTSVYGHYGSDGSSVHDRIARVGYVTSGWNGENWAVSDTVEKSIYWWMDDAPHRENVLNRSYTEMGIGVAPHPGGWGLILVTDFSTGNVNGAEGYVPGSGQTDVVGAIAAPAPIANSTAPVADSGLRYTVSAGDTLFSISQRYRTDWQSIAQLNGLGNGSLLSIGTELRLPATGFPGTGANQAKAPAREIHRYTVSAGDTLLGIALRFGVEWQALAGANGLGESSLLQIGAQLTIPGLVNSAGTAPQESVSIASTPTVRTPTHTVHTHTVSAGETIWVIAARYGVDWRALLQANGLNEQALLQIGQVLTLP